MNALIRKNPEPLDAFRVIAAVLKAPRDRLGRLDITASDEARSAREELRELACKFNVSGCRDIMEQCAKVANAAIDKANPTNIDRLLHAGNLATVYLGEIDNAGARHVNSLLRDALKPWKQS